MSEEIKHSPTKWYQWVLLYPVLATSVLGSVPTAWQAYKAWKLDVNFRDVQKVEEQRQLWERNAYCLRTKGIYSADGPDDLTVRVILCDTGDALLGYKYKEYAVVYVWVKRPNKPKEKVLDHETIQ